MGYRPANIEPKWQDYWLKNETFRAEVDHQKTKLYVLDMFPYPSGNGLHVGHPEGYTATDIYCRYKRMRGFNVLHCMGWDAFGLPAEQHALRTGTHPKETTQKNIENFKRQIQALGFSYDWSREINTTDQDYYQWTQWIFLQIYKKGLAYQDYAPVNWCPALRSVLANEEVIDNKSEIGGHEVVKRPLRQWLLKITDYAEPLLEGLDNLDWPNSVKQMQRNWIGKSTGAEVVFQLDQHPEKLTIFTTRPDTLFGATYCAIAPEHPLIEKITTADCKKQVVTYQKAVATKSDALRLDESQEKSGVFCGAYAINPLNMQKIPIWVADYVLITYGSGAIMAVPAHDTRDFEFAKRYQLPIIEVVKSADAKAGQAFTGEGTAINSGMLNDLQSQQARNKITEYLEQKRLGKRKTQYKLRDWLFSRQRYWGEPIPIVLDKDNQPEAVDEAELPLVLPEIQEFQPSETGESPLAKAKDWVACKNSKGEAASRETNTMPQWAGSCWYYLRFCDPNNKESAWSAEAERYWMPVDLYVGGAEHAVLHLLYARFWHKVLYDLGHVHTAEPFQKLVNQGIILGPDNQKMSKSRGNVVNPDQIIEAYGADAMRLYEMFMGPLDKMKPWQTNGIEGMYRFLKKLWHLFCEPNVQENAQLKPDIQELEPNADTQRWLHQSIKKITNDIENLKFNTAISQLMVLTNQFSTLKIKPKKSLESLVLLVSPFAPHLAEELWQKLGHPESLAYQPWPKYAEQWVVQNEWQIPVQINGKVRAQIQVTAADTQQSALDLALKVDKIRALVQNKTVHKVFYVPKKILNLVM